MKYKNNLIFYTLLIIYAVFLAKTLGYSPKVPSIISSFLFLFYTAKLSRYLFAFCLVILSTLGAFYLPEAVLRGSLSGGTIISLFETHSNEAIEYLRSLPSHLYIGSIIFIAFSILVLLSSRRWNPPRLHTVIT